MVVVRARCPPVSGGAAVAAAGLVSVFVPRKRDSDLVLLSVLEEVGGVHFEDQHDAELTNGTERLCQNPP